MIVDNIKNSPIIFDPWPHKVIKNFLDNETFLACQNVANKIVSMEEFHKKEILWMSDVIELFGLKDDVEIIVNAADKLMDHVEEISKDFPERLQSKLGYFNNPRFGISMAAEKNEIHDEGNNKVMALITYIEPDENSGTLLYRENHEKTFVKEIKWEQNTAFMMYSIPNKTWHKFDSKDGVRVTLNFYYEKIEALEHLNKFSSVKQLSWLHEQFGKNKLIRENL